MFDAVSFIRGHTGIGVLAPARAAPTSRGIEETLRASGDKAMSCKDRVGGPVGAIRPFVPTQGHDDARDDIAEALDHIARAIAAIDHNIHALIAKLDSESTAVARLAASLETKPR